MGTTYACPCDETGDPGDIDEPVEACSTARGNIHESQETEEGCEGHGVDGDIPVCAFEDRVGEAFVCEADEDAGCGVDV